MLKLDGEMRLTRATLRVELVELWLRGEPTRVLWLLIHKEQPTIVPLTTLTKIKCLKSLEESVCDSSEKCKEWEISMYCRNILLEIRRRRR